MRTISSLLPFSLRQLYSMSSCKGSEVTHPPPAAVPFSEGYRTSWSAMTTYISPKGGLIYTGVSVFLV